MIERGMFEHREARPHRAGLGVIAPVNKPRYACLNHGAGAHSARLDSDVESAPQETVIAERVRHRAHRNDLCVRCGIAGGDRCVSGARHYLVLENNDSAYWHLALSRSRARLSEGYLHVTRISHSDLIVG